MRGDTAMNVSPKERTECINIRVTPEEKAALKKLAAAAGMTLTGFLLGEALGEKIGDAIMSIEKALELDPSLLEVAKVDGDIIDLLPEEQKIK